MGACVDFHDSANFNYRQALGLTSCLNAEGMKEAISILHGIKARSGYITSTFSEQYFTSRENAWLDGYLAVDKALTGRNIRQVLFYAVAQACLQKRPFNLFHRENLSIRTNKNVQRSFGNAATWNKPFADLASRHVRSVHDLSRTRKGRRAIRVLRPQSPLRLGAGYDLVYLDPPYLPVKRTIESYMLRYHFLEGLSAPHRWGRVFPGMKNPLGSSEAWEDKGDSALLLDRMLKKHRASIVALSYAAEGLPTIDAIVALFEKNFRKCEVHSYSARRTLSNSYHSDVLVIGVP